MASISSTLYHFDPRKLANWSTAQEKALSQEYPFHVPDEPLEQYVQRTYLQFLWLPDSLMPLPLLIPSLRRVHAPSTSDPSAPPHPMHDLLAPLLLTPRAATNKYHIELPRILMNGGGAGEMEETMMWYAVTHEQPDETHPLPEHADGPWADETWREAYLERMERREVQIQILLYFHKLSLPGPAPRLPKPKKRKRHPAEPVTPPEDHLEAFMDKLSTWQLVHSLARAAPTTSQKQKQKMDERDWTQVFAEDVVEHHFKPHLPELCALLRSKLFPSSPFSDSDSDSSNPPNPNPNPNPPNPTSQPPTTEPPTRSLSRLSPTSRAHPLARSRSRSLSLSLAQEQQERSRASAAPSKKRLLNREISMSRVFKPRPKPAARPAEPTKVEASKPRLKDTDVVLVEDTPQKPRILSAALPFAHHPKLPALTAHPAPTSKTRTAVALDTEEDADDEEWMLDSSPNVVLLNPPRSSSSVSSGLAGMDSDEEGDDVSMGEATPSKPPSARVLRPR